MTLQVDLRRCRFVEYQPDGVNVCAWSPTGYAKASLVAVMRPKSGLELWRVEGDEEARMIGRFHPNGLVGKSVEGLAWSLVPSEDESNVSPRLFSVGLDGLLVEWDLGRFCPMRWMDTNGGGAGWCLAVSPDQTTLVVGCEAGRVQLVTLLSKGRHPVLRAAEKPHAELIQQGGRVISVAWSPDGQLIAAGSPTSLLTVFNATTGRALHVLRLEKDSVRDGKRGRIIKEAIVWAVAFSGNNALVSVDSNGRLCVWCLRTGTLSQAFDLSDADLFSVVSTSDADEERLFAAGADQRLFELRKTAGGQWYVSGKRKVHSHDIRSLSIGNASDGSKVVLSGSVDSILVATSISSGKAKLRFPMLNGAKTVQLDNGLMTAALGSVLRIWDMTGDAAVPPRLLLELRLADPIEHFAVAEDLLAVATLNGALKVYRLVVNRDMSNAAEEVELVEIDLSKQVTEAITGRALQALLFADDQLLVFTGGSAKSLCQLHNLQVTEECTLLSSKDLNQRVKHIKDVQLHQSTLAVLESSLQQIFLCDLENPGKVNAIVQADKPLDLIQFNPSNGLLICAGTRYLVQYSLAAESFVEWPKRLKTEISEMIEKQLPPTSPIGIAFPQGDDSKFILYGRDFVLSFDLEDRTAQPKKRTSTRGKKQEEPATEQASEEPHSAVRLTKTYDSILFFDFINAKEAVLVERPWLDIAAGFPPVFKRKLFGGRQ